MPKILLNEKEAVDVVAGVVYYINNKFFKTFKEEEALIELYRENPKLPWRRVKKQYIVLPTSTDTEIKAEVKIIELK